MPKRKPTRKKKTRKRSRKSKPFKSSLIKAFTGLAILVLVVVIAGFLAHIFLGPQKPSKTAETPIPSKPAEAPKPSKPAKTPKPAPVVKQPVAKIPPMEIYPPKEIPPEKKPYKHPTQAKSLLPQVAIIIDDLGYDEKIAEKLGKLDSALTFSILPHSPFQKKIDRIAKDKGFETILHLPMEPMEYPSVNPGPGTLLTSMTPDQLILQLEKNLDAVPSIKGVNNHMGSKMTTESSHMYQIFSILKKRNLFFVDSRTTSETLCKPSARLFQIPFAQRDVFLDHRQEKQFIRSQLKKLVQVAQQNGFAIGIGHPHLITYEVLRQMLPEMQKEVQLVPVSQLVQLVG